jgi:hypothetical protein
MCPHTTLSVYICGHKDVSAAKQQGSRRAVGLQSGSAGAAFLKLLETLEQDGVIEREFATDLPELLRPKASYTSSSEREFATDLPEHLGGVCGWTVKDGMMEGWQRRRQVRPHSTICVLVLLHMCSYCDGGVAASPTGHKH